VSSFKINDFKNGPTLLKLATNYDKRGSFTEVCNYPHLKSLHPNMPSSFLQINLIEAKLKALRGFHGAHEADNHWKIVTCVSGGIIDAYLDIRSSSDTFGEIAFVMMNSLELHTVIIPPGFAHAMQSTSKVSKVIYSTNKVYSDQKEIDINPFQGLRSTFWLQKPILSQRDSTAQSFVNLIKKGDFLIR